MDKIAIIKYCKELGCCDACCIRYLGHRNPAAFENTHEFLKKLLGPEGGQSTEVKPIEQTSTHVTNTKLSEIGAENEENKHENSESASNIEINAEQENNGSKNNETASENQDINDQNVGNGEKVEKNGTEACKIDVNDSENEGTPAKRVKRSDVCFSCIGILQEQNWEEAVRLARAEMEAKGYECATFACALSGPISTALRERVVALRIRERFPSHSGVVTPLKEAWKWSFCGPRLAHSLGLRLESGAVAPLLLTFCMEYKDDKDELRLVSPRASNRRELESRLSSLDATGAIVAGVTAPVAPAVCVRVRAEREPIYVGGRYIKLSRSLPQTPWLVGGQRMLPSSVQEVICEELGALLGAPSARLKLVAAGREDVDVRCLGTGRPFAVEIVDPRVTPTQQQLRDVCAKISRHEHVKVSVMNNVNKAQLVDLKRGEETKLKSYEALCIKLRHTDEDIASGVTPSSPVVVSERDIDRVNALTPPALELKQRTPLRVLHRRPLHTRSRRLLEVRAHLVPDHPQLMRVRLVAEAGTYIKEWVHGEVGRTTPSLRDVVPVDILALDVTEVQLDWPPS